MAAVCPVVGTTTNTLPPHHPEISTDPEARCPVTNAKVEHHDQNVIHSHPSAPTVPSDDKEAMDASQCPALKGANTASSITDSTCPVVGPVNSSLPPAHPQLTESEAGAVCPVTNAKLEHHKGKVHAHKSVPKDAPAQKCPVAGAGL